MVPEPGEVVTEILHPVEEQPVWVRRASVDHLPIDHEAELDARISSRDLRRH